MKARSPFARRSMLSQPIQRSNSARAGRQSSTTLPDTLRRRAVSCDHNRPGWLATSHCAGAIRVAGAVDGEETEAGGTESSGLAREQVNEVLCRKGGGSRILASDDPAIHNRKWLPVGDLLEDRPQPQQLVLDQEGHNVGQLNFCLLAIREPSHMFAFHKRNALVGHMTKDTRGMAHQSHRLAGNVERNNYKK